MNVIDHFFHSIIIKRVAVLVFSMISTVCICGCFGERADQELNQRAQSRAAIPRGLHYDFIAQFEVQPVTRRTFLLESLLQRKGYANKQWQLIGHSVEQMWVQMLDHKCSLKLSLHNQFIEKTRQLFISIRARGEFEPSRPGALIPIQFSLNGVNVGLLKLSASPALYSFPIARHLLKKGTNQFLFQITDRALDVQKNKPLLSSLIISTSSPKVSEESLLSSGFNDLVRVTIGEKRFKAFAQTAGQSLDFDLTIPRAAYLYFSLSSIPLIHQPQNPVVARIRLKEEANPATILWQKEISVQSDNDRTWDPVELSLEKWSGTRVNLSFSVESSHPDRKNQVLILWGQPLLLGKQDLEVQAPSPDVFLILIDTLRADRLGLYGYKQGRTPELDKLSKSAVVFQDVSAQAPSTLLSVSALLTGKYPRILTGIDRGPEKAVSSAGDEDHASPGKISPPHQKSNFSITDKIGHESLAEVSVSRLPQIYKRNGYYTVGISTNPLISRRHGFQAGFDYFDDKLTFLPAAAVLAEYRALTVPKKVQPTFLYLHFMDPHFPYHPPEPYTFFALQSRDNYGTFPRPWHRKENHQKLYDMEITYLDKVLGTLFNDMKYYGNFQHTLLFLVSDHGEEFREHGHSFHNSSLHYEQISVPLIAHIPPVLSSAQGLLVDSPIALFDLFPTILQMCGLETPEKIEAESFWSSLHGAPGSRQDKIIFSELRNLNFLKTDELISVRQGPWKLITSLTSQQNKLYNLERDPGEFIDVATEKDSPLQYLSAKIRQEYLQPEKQQKMTFDQKSLEQDLKALGYLEE
ncbi:sulfatase [candidate division CSSED10-310 bacterium]|uniref:Sulfatase n=1 Tax=candidate division CSSED10-310 bacterium TaxID=2855610 RepID=A0ABV6Z5I9_UNCC1